MDVYRLLQDVDFFKGIALNNVKALAEICIPKAMEKRGILFLEGQEGHSMYILSEGSVQLHKTAPDGREIVIKTIRPGEIFGEVILFEQNTYPVSAVVLKKSLVLMLPRLQIECLLANGSFQKDFIGMRIAKQRYLTERILYLTAHDVEDRFFLFLKEQFGVKEEYRVSMKKKDIAAAIGTIPETFSRLILHLKEEGLITWEGKTIKLRKSFWEKAEA